MRLSFETTGGSNYLVYELQPEDRPDTVSLGMLTNNSIPGLAETAVVRTDDKTCIKYNITAGSSAALVFSGPMDRGRLLTILRSMVSALLLAEDYLIERSSILLDKEHIFIDSTTGQAVLICQPLLREAGQPDLAAFFREVIFGWTRLDRDSDPGFMAGLTDYFHGVSELSLEDFGAMLENMSGDDSPESGEKGSGKADPVPAGAAVPGGTDRSAAATRYADTRSDSTGGGGTGRPCLIRVRTGEVIELNKALFRIGRERRAVDYAIAGNPAISKRHVEIRFQEGEFQVWDEKSTNHTYVNGKRIDKKTWVTIRTGDTLRLAGEAFECRLN